MKPNTYSLFVVLVLFFSASGCSENPVAIDALEDDVVLPRVERVTGDGETHYAEGNFRFEWRHEMSIPGPGIIEGKIRFYVVEEDGDKGAGWFKYKETNTLEKVWFRAKIKRFEMVDAQTAVFSGPIKRGYHVGLWVFIEVQDNGAQGDVLQYRIGPRGSSGESLELDVVEGDIVCGVQ